MEEPTNYTYAISCFKMYSKHRNNRKLRRAILSAMCDFLWENPDGLPSVKHTNKFNEVQLASKLASISYA